eukprot:gb/GECG01015812.1/.p1 GENE.gb/GECG01015812.1/~~gb/GECG01015812.1/.p1  ORF type:complete len:569 (+),score=52.06 gb/GECG01015812.1/:1-1707(+)
MKGQEGTSRVRRHARGSVLLGFIVVLQTLSSVYSRSTQATYDEVSYQATVVEYAPKRPPISRNPVSREQALLLMNENVDALLNALEKYRGPRLDLPQMAVFPEDGLYGPGFPTRDSILPFLEPIPDVNGSTAIDICSDFHYYNQSSPILAKLACAAKSLETDLVVDMGELRECSSDTMCPRDGRWQFNAAVALDRYGMLRGKYRKSHLFYEYEFNEPPEGPQPSYWESSFGVRFGMFICFDIMFSDPPRELIQQDVKDIVYPTWWVNYPPFLTGNAVQFAFANSYNINLIASGSGSNWRNSGSGLYGYFRTQEARQFTCRVFKGNKEHPNCRGMISKAPSCTNSGNSLSFYNPSWSSHMAVLSGVLNSTNRNGRESDAAHGGTFTAVKNSPHDLADSSDFHLWCSPDGSQCMNATVLFVNSSSCENEKCGVTVVREDLKCSVNFSDSRQTSGSTTLSVLAAVGEYKGLFSTRMCGVAVCPSANISCFIDGTEQSLFHNHSISNVQIAGNYEEWWEVFGNGIGDGGAALLDDEIHLENTSKRRYTLQYTKRKARSFNAMLLYALKKPKL